jgi:dolichol-phosphate mannosyltransferase
MPTLSIVVPTFNEVDNVRELRDRLDAALAGIDWEVIFVDDDSPDGTARYVAELAQQDPRVRSVLRIGRRGLSSACIEGMLASTAPLVAVIDGDLQHDETRLPAMARMLQDDPALEVAVGSRYVESGSVGGWDVSRARISRWATQLARLVLKAELHDPMSGFFMIRREVLVRCVRAGVSGVGFKILLDLFATAPEPLRFREVPYTFRARRAGQSKLDTNVAWEFFVMLLDRFLGRVVPIRFIAFSLIGGLGLGVHLAVLALLFRVQGDTFMVAEAGATLAAMSFNFVLNNLLTYRDMRLRGWGLLRGWASFVLACSIGALANVGLAVWMFEHRMNWVASAVAGVLVGAVWNYAVTSVYTWRRPQAG